MQGNGAQYKIKAILETNDIKSNAKQIQNALTGIKLPKGMKSQFLSLFDELDQSVDSFQSKLNQGFKKGSDITALKKNADQISKVYQSIIRNVEKMGEGGVKTLVKFDTQEIEEAKRKITDLQNQLRKEVEASGLDKVTETMKKLKTVSKNQNLDGFFKAFNSGDLQTAQKHLENLRKSAAGFSNTANLQVFNQGLDQLEASLKTLGSSSALPQIIANIARMDGELTNLKDEEIQKMVTFLEQAADASREAAQASKVYTNSVVDSTTAQHRLNQEVSEVKDRVKYFLSLANGVELFKRAVRDAFETVKELDAVMTETAVVTEFDVSDMWDKLPEYTKLANQLGATIKGTYETMTLFYQQGLTTNEVFAVGAETMKMARIAGLEYEKATNLMTAALRGFNMELNETSAGRINDVYSKLAAITASSTGEIADAMTKTASIANSANMQFETTAAFLAQMIETTREPAENLGTAMKTIIARFTEMKEAPSDIFEFDGEEVNVNKVDAALASVGVSLKDAKGEFRELDQVFLELASKWDSLDIMSQRYVATMAAGSRQQSRFIAMMSNYGRTMELVNAAQKSAGASQEQFKKTKESLTAKINELKNAWHEYILGISNSSVIKGVVDLLTKLLETINKLTYSSNGFLSSIGKIGVAFGTFKIARGAFNKVSTGLSSILGNAMKEAGVGTGEALGDGIAAGVSKKSKKGLFGSIGADLKAALPMDLALGSLGLDGMTGVKNQIREMDVLRSSLGDLESKMKTFKITKDNTFDDRSIAAGAKSFNAALAAQNKSLALTDAQMTVFKANLKGGMGVQKAYATATYGSVVSQKLLEDATEDCFDETVMAILQEAKLAKERGDTAKATQLSALAEKALAGSRRQSATAGFVSNITQGIDGATQKLTNFTNLMKGTAQVGVKGLGGALKTTFKGVGTSIGGLASSIGSLMGALLPYIAVVAAIAAAVASIYLVVQKFKNTDKENLKKAKEQTEQATTAAEKAKESYEELSDSLEGLKSATNNLKTLEKGTLEWRQALLEVNGTVIDLLNKYPSLAKYVENIDGQLVISEEGQKEAQKKANQQMSNALINQQTAQLLESKAQGQVSLKTLSEQIPESFAGRSEDAWEFVKDMFNPKELVNSSLLGLFTDGIEDRWADYKKNFAEGNWGDAALQTLSFIGLGGILGFASSAGKAAENASERNKQDAELVAKKFIEEPDLWLPENKAQLDEFAKQVGTTGNALLEMRDELEAYSRSQIERQNTELAITQSILNTAASQEVQDSEQFEGYVSAFSRGFLKQNNEDLIAAEKARLGASGTTGYDGAKEQLKELGITEEFENQKAAFVRLYSELTGVTVEKVKEMEMSEQDLAEAIARINVTNDYAEKMNKFYENHKGEEGAGRLMKASTYTDLELVFSDIDISSEENFAKQLGMSVSELNSLANEMGYAWGELYNEFADRQGQAEKRIVEATKTSLGTFKSYYNDLPDEKKKIALQLIEDGESFKSFEEFVRRVEVKTVEVKVKTAAENSQVLNQVIKEIQDKGSFEGIDAEISTEFLAKLQQIKGLYDENSTAAQEWTRVQNQGAIQQMAYLNRLGMVQAGMTPVNMEGTQAAQEAQSINEAQQVAQAAKKALADLELQKNLLVQAANNWNGSPVVFGDQTFTSLDQIKTAIQDITVEIEEMQDFEEIPDPFESIVASAENLMNLSDGLAAAAAKIGEGFIVAADDISFLRQQFPEILKDATQVGDGTIKLNAEVVNSVLGSYADLIDGNGEVTKSSIENKIAELKAEIETTKSKIALAEKAAQGMVNLDAGEKEALSKHYTEYTDWVKQKSGEATTQVTADNGEQEQSAGDLGSEIIATSNDYAEIGNSSGKSTDVVTKNNTTMANSTYNNGRQAAETAKAYNSIGGVPYFPNFVGGTGGSGVRTSGTATKNQAKNTKVTSIGDLKRGEYEILAKQNPGTYDPTSPEYQKKHSAISKSTIGDLNLSDIDWDAYIGGLKDQLASQEGQLTQLEALLVEVEAKNNRAQHSLNSAASGKGGNPKSGSGSKGSKDSSKKVEPYKDDTDPSWNTLQKLNIENRRQEELQDAYDQLVEDDTASLQDLLNNLSAQEASLLAEQALDKDLLGQRQAQLDKLLKNSKYAKYVSVDKNTGTLYYNQALIKSQIDGSTNEEFTKGWTDFKKEVETAAKNIEEAIDLRNATAKDLVELRKTDAEKDFNDNRYNNTITWLVAVHSELETQTAEMEILEKEFDALIKSSESTPKQIANSLLRQIDNLEGQKSLQKEIIRLNEHYLREYLKENKDLNQYANYDWATKEVKIDAGKIAKIVNKEKGEEVNKYIDKLEEYRNALNTANSTLYDIEANTEELKNYGKDEYADMEQRIWDAIVKQKQDELDELQEINDTIKDNAKDLADSFRESLEKERQARENAEKEKSIGDKEARLSYLRRDTTGANREEIMALEKELKEEKQDYTDTLIDQKLSEIEAQNDIAGKQREEMIKKLEKEIELLEKNPDWARVSTLISTSVDTNGTMNKNSALYLLLAKSEEADKMSQTQRENWDKELQQQFNQGYGGAIVSGNQLENLNLGLAKNSKVSFFDKNGALRTGTYDGNGNVYVDKDGMRYTYKEIFKDPLGVFRTYEDTPKGVAINPPAPAPAPAPTPAPSGGSSSSSSNRAPTPAPAPAPTINVGSAVVVNKNATRFGSKSNNAKMASFVPGGSYTVYKLESGQALIGKNGAYTGWVNLKDLTLKNSGGSSNSGTSSSNSTTTSGAGYFKTPDYNGGSLVDGLKASVYGSNPKNWPANQKLFDKIGGNLDKLSSVNGNKSRSQMLTLLKQGKLKKIKAFAKGGLVDFTGPAWLDGTKTKPEAFLSAADTKNFMELRDVLASFKMTAAPKKQETTNNAHFTINVNVDKIDNDYDVDLLVNRVKKDILTNSQYRNVTAINFRR